MDIGMLLDMDKFNGTAPAVYSTIDLAVLSSNSNAISGAQLTPRNSKTHLHALRHSDDPHDPVLWNREDQPYIAKQWPPEDSYHYSSPSHGALGVDSGAAGPCNRPLVEYSSSIASPSSFSNDPGSYSFASGSQVHSTNLSVQSREDIQWEMYLTASLSNPLTSLEFCATPPTLSYPPDHEEGMGMPEPLSLPPPSFLPSPSSFPIVDAPDLFDPRPYIDVPSQLSSRFPSSHTIPSNLSQGNIVDNLLPADTDEAPRNDQTRAIPDGTYSALMELTPPVYTFESNSLSSLEAPSMSIAITTALASPHNSSPLRGRSLARVQPSPAHSGRGLSGWSDTDHLQVPSLNTPSSSGKRRRSKSTSSSILRRRRYGTSPLSSAPESEASSSIRGSKRSRMSTGSALNTALYLDQDAEEGIDIPIDDGDSDDYRPSRSPSEEPSFSSSFLPLNESNSEIDFKDFALTKMKPRRKSGKAKGSAALALAVVTQLGSKRARREQCDVDLDVLALYQEGKTGIRKRKNHPIPLPIPIPNLNKNSRGRKVPYVADLGTGSPSGSFACGSSVKEEEAESSYGTGSETLRSGRVRRRPATPIVDELPGSRTFVCVEAGCGKCFVRSEHLKRHVRSIHTHDKPHPCPYEGCDKSFSRRDNLGQHVRIHLEP